MSNWLSRRLDAVLTEVIAAMVLAVLAAAGVALWAILRSASGPVVMGVTVVVFGGVLLAVNQGLSLWSRRRTPTEPKTPMRFDFDPYSISSQLAGADLSGLFAPESYMTFTLNVRNVSGHVVKIKGVEGRIRCCGEECNMPATVELTPRQLSTLSSDRVPCMIRQPVTDGMMQVVMKKGIYGDGTLTFSLAALKWTGAVDSPEGSAPLENCYVLQDDFAVQGPIREKEDGSTLFLLRARFISSRWYSSDGLPKPDA